MTTASIQQLLAGLYPVHFRELLAPLIRVSGSFERAEDAVHEAFAQALATWSEQGLPDEPLAWLRQVAKNRVLDGLRRQRTWQAKERQLATQIEVDTQGYDDEACLKDDVLRLIFTCCHPSLATEAQIALTLRTVCGLTSEQVARSLLLKPTTLQQRIVRAKQKIDLAKIPYVIPDAEHLPERLSAALRTMYLVFNEGYGATEGDSLTRADLCEEAIRLVRLTNGLMPEQFEPQALLALMLLHHSRRAARTDADGQLIRLEDQDRTRWDTELIAEALPLVDTVLVARPLSTYAIEAAIAALHARASRAEETDWLQIAALYTVLEQRSGGSPVVALNAAVAVAMAGDLAEGLRRLQALEQERKLPGYHLLPAAKADLLSRMGRLEEAKAAYAQAISLATNDVERRFLERRLERA
jgi:RNA polymerase sigma-70 factor, ECF subfamily